MAGEIPEPDSFQKLMNALDLAAANGDLNAQQLMRKKQRLAVLMVQLQEALGENEVSLPPEVSYEDFRTTIQIVLQRILTGSTDQETDADQILAANVLAALHNRHHP